MRTSSFLSQIDLLSEDMNRPYAYEASEDDLRKWEKAEEEKVFMAQLAAQEVADREEMLHRVATLIAAHVRGRWAQRLAGRTFKVADRPDVAVWRIVEQGSVYGVSVAVSECGEDTLISTTLAAIHQ